MKLRLPSRLVQALLTTCAAALSSTTASADVPSGYTPVIITDADQLNHYQHADNTAFIISADITDSVYQMTGAHQYWGDSAENEHVLTFSNLSKYARAQLIIENEFIVENFKGLNLIENDTWCDYSHAGAIYGGLIRVHNNESVLFDGNYTHSTNPDGGAINGSTIHLEYNTRVVFSENYAYGSSGVLGGAIYAAPQF